MFAGNVWEYKIYVVPPIHLAESGEVCPVLCLLWKQGNKGWTFLNTSLTDLRDLLPLEHTWILHRKRTFTFTLRAEVMTQVTKVSLGVSDKKLGLYLIVCLWNIYIYCRLFAQCTPTKSTHVERKHQGHLMWGYQERHRSEITLSYRYHSHGRNYLNDRPSLSSAPGTTTLIYSCHVCWQSLLPTRSPVQDVGPRTVLVIYQSAWTHYHMSSKPETLVCDDCLSRPEDWRLNESCLHQKNMFQPLVSPMPSVESMP